MSYVPPGAVRWTPDPRVVEAASSLERQLSALSIGAIETPPRSRSRPGGLSGLSNLSGVSSLNATPVRVGGGGSAMGGLELSFPLSMSTTPMMSIGEPLSSAKRPSSARLQRRQRQHEAELQQSPAATSQSGWLHEADEIRRGLRAASYTIGGEDWQKLMQRYESRRGAGLLPEEFAQAVRRHVKGADRMRERDMQALFAHIDRNASGVIEPDEWNDFLRGGRSGPPVGGTPSVARATRPGTHGSRQATTSDTDELVISTAHARVGVTEEVSMGTNRVPLQQVYHFFLTNYYFANLFF